MTPQQYVQEKAAASGSSFYYAFLFLPRPRREAITAFYAFCREVDDVVDEVSDPGVAATKLGQLRDPTRVKPWLYAIARHEIFRSTKQRSRSTSLDALGDDFGMDPMASPDPHADGAVQESQELASLVRDAAAGLDPTDQLAAIGAVLALGGVRHERSGSALITVLRVSGHRATVIALVLLAVRAGAVCAYAAGARAASETPPTPKTAVPRTVSGRPTRVTNRPAAWAATALPTANAVTASAVCSAL